MSNYNINSRLINQMFEDKFLNSYRDLRKRRKSRVLTYISSIYRRWYYSALVEDTYLSPANLFAFLGGNQERNHKNAIMSPVTRLAKSGKNRIEFKMLEYSVYNHPVISDLKIFIESCTPDVELGVNDMLMDGHVEDLMGKLSMWDSFYVEYLLNISIVMGIIKKSPSIYSNRAQVTSEYQRIFGLSNDEIFGAIVKATVNSASSFINEMIPLPETYFTRETIYELLKHPMTVDEIFQHVYNILGIKIQDIYSYENDSDPFFDDLNNAIISSTFLLGLLLDKCFLTPFGYYLQLIRPLYTLPYEFFNELSYLADSFEEEEGLVTALYAPSTFYQLTPLGLGFFGIENNDLFIPADEIPYNDLPEIVSGNTEFAREQRAMLKWNFSIAEESSMVIYSIKVKLADKKTLWKNIDVPGNIMLFHLFSEICYQFSLDPGSEYSFFKDMTESPFTEYTSIKRPRRSKSAADTALIELDLPEKHHFMLVIYNSFNPYIDFDMDKVSKKIKLELEVIKIKNRDETQSYPRVSRISSGFKDLEE
ncbi:MAG: hypothetical protein LBB94_07125 [Clostridiales bacterium]|jgi:hypothetical protein|nr:hypothetical protein [Clostridiales bacterium]